VALGDWIRKIFSSDQREEEAVEREEYGTPDRTEEELQQEGFPSFAGVEGADAAEEELEEFKAPPDPAP
jgi:hypothetical protein